MRAITVLLIIVMVAAGSEGLVSHPSVFGQNLTITTTMTEQIATTMKEQVINQPFDMNGTYVEEYSVGEVNYENKICSVVFLPDQYNGVSLSAGDTLTGEIIANNDVQLAIITGLPMGGGTGGCTALFQEAGVNEYYSLYYYSYKNGGQPLQFQWNVTTSDYFFFVLLNPNSWKVKGSLSINRVYAAQEQLLTQVYTSYTSSSITSTPFLPQPPQPMATQSTSNTPQLVLAIVAVAVVFIGAVFLYSRRKPKVTQAGKVDTTRLSSKTVEDKRLCIECGNELHPNLRFCDSCGTRQP